MTFRPQDLKHTYLTEARRLGDLYKINLLLSGGIDSEVMARSFHEAKVPFSAFIGRFQNNLNQKEVDSAIKLCNRLGVRPNFLDVNVYTYLNEILPQDAETFGSSNIPKLFQYHLATLVKEEGMTLLGYSPYIRKRVPNGYVPGVYPYLYSAWDIVRTEVIGGYDTPYIREFATTEDCQLAFMMHPRTLELVTNRVDGKISTNTSRRIIYSQYDGVEERPRSYGFNKVHHEYKTIYDKLTELFPKYEKATEFFSVLGEFSSLHRRGTYE